MNRRSFLRLTIIAPTAAVIAANMPTRAVSWGSVIIPQRKMMAHIHITDEAMDFFYRDEKARAVSRASKV